MTAPLPTARTSRSSTDCGTSFKPLCAWVLSALSLAAYACSNGDAEHDAPSVPAGLTEYVDQTIAPPVPEPVESDQPAAAPIVWSFDGDGEVQTERGKPAADGWVMRHEIARATLDRGRLILEPSGNDAQLVIRGTFDLRTHGVLEVRMASEVDTNVGIFWTFGDESFNSDQASVARLKGGRIRTIQLPLGDTVPVQHTVTAFRFDPTDELERVGIDEIRLVPSTRDPIRDALESTSFQIDEEQRPGRAFLSTFETLDVLDLPSYPILERSVANLSTKTPMVARIEAETEEGIHRSLETVVAPSSGWRDLRLDLGGLGAERVRVRTRLSIDSRDNESELGILGEGRVIERRDASQPDVLLISIDTLRADHLSVYGHSRKTTPNLDRLAARSVRFDRPVTQSPWTLPSVASYLTSRYPRSLGIHFAVRHSIPEEVPTLAELLRDEGYDTACVFANSVMEGDLGFERGFSSFAFGIKHEFHADETTDRALAWLEPRGDRRTFLYAHYMDPHSPYQPPGDAWRTNPFYDESDVTHPPVNNSDLFYGREEATPERTALLLRMYDAEIRYADEHIGRLLDALETDGRLDDMLIIVTSDHGEEFDDHGNWNHAITLYDEMLRVPLFVKFPRDEGAGTVVHASTPLLDIVPTILEAAGISYGHLDIEGRPLGTPAEGTADTEDRELFAETNVHGPVRSCVVTEDWKLIRFELEHGYWNDEDVLYQWMKESHPLVSLFDREADPSEQVNLAERRPDVVVSLSQRIQQFRQAESAVAPPFESEGDGTPQADKETLRKLRALGYLDDEEADEAAEELKRSKKRKRE